jgi:hypothetical protein
MKYNEEKIINLLRADFSEDSKIKYALKARLCEKRARKKSLLLGLSFGIATVVIAALLLSPSKKNEYVYNQYPVTPFELYYDSYGKAGPNGLNLWRY